MIEISLDNLLQLSLVNQTDREIAYMLIPDPKGSMYCFPISIRLFNDLCPFNFRVGRKGRYYLYTELYKCADNCLATLS